MGIETQAEIRQATTDEVAAAFAIVTEYYQAANVVVRESVEQFRGEYFAPRGGVWLAWAGGEIAGCIALRGMKNAAHAEIKRMYIRPAWRGQGLAQKLLEEAERFAAKSRYQRIYLDTTDEMISAARLYERNGYQRCARYNSNPQATIFMRKNLRNPDGA